MDAHRRGPCAPAARATGYKGARDKPPGGRGLPAPVACLTLTGTIYPGSGSPYLINAPKSTQFAVGSILGRLDGPPGARLTASPLRALTRLERSGRGWSADRELCSRWLRRRRVPLRRQRVSGRLKLAGGPAACV